MFRNKIHNTRQVVPKTVVTTKNILVFRKLFILQWQVALDTSFWGPYLKKSTYQFLTWPNSCWDIKNNIKYHSSGHLDIKSFENFRQNKSNEESKPLSMFIDDFYERSQITMVVNLNF